MNAESTMDARLTSWSLFLLLLLVMCSYGSQARELAVIGNKVLENAVDEGGNIEHKHEHDAHVMHHVHGDQMDPSIRVFFTMKDLKVGKRMPIHFPKRDPAKSPKLWPREQAESLPFSLNQLPYLLEFFSFSPDSPQAKAMEDTLRECESKSINGEVKFCATSIESMLDFIQSILGPNSDIQVLNTAHKTKSSVNFQNYTFLQEPMEIPAPKMVACHTMPYPYTIFYCHSQMSQNKVYRISLAGENGDRVDAMVVCHLDTSQWTPSHISFKVLGVVPGTSSVCHFFPADHLIWVPKQQNQGFSSM